MSLFVLKNIQDLVSRLTQTRAENLDNLDAPISGLLGEDSPALLYLDAPVSEAKGEISVDQVVASGAVTAPEGATWAHVILVGGGGGGQDASRGAGGSGGDIIEFTTPVSSGQGYTVTIGAGGAVGADGGDTSVNIGGTTWVAKGGPRGASEDSTGADGRLYFGRQEGGRGQPAHADAGQSWVVNADRAGHSQGYGGDSGLGGGGGGSYGAGSDSALATPGYGGGGRGRDVSGAVPATGGSGGLAIFTWSA